MRGNESPMVSQPLRRHFKGTPTTWNTEPPEIGPMHPKHELSPGRVEKGPTGTGVLFAPKQRIQVEEYQERNTSIEETRQHAQMQTHQASRQANKL